MRKPIAFAEMTRMRACLPGICMLVTLTIKKMFVSHLFNVFVVAKPTKIVLDKQNFKCLPNNVCPFDSKPSKYDSETKNSVAKALRKVLKLSGVVSLCLKKSCSK